MTVLWALTNRNHTSGSFDDMQHHLRAFFEVDRHFIALAALKALADDGVIARDKVSEAISRYGINVDKANPVAV